MLVTFFSRILLEYGREFPIKSTNFQNVITLGKVSIKINLLYTILLQIEFN